MNFGDDLSQHLVAQLSGRPVIWESPRETEMFAVGSLIDKIRKSSDFRAREKRPILWGSGMLSPQDIRIQGFIDVRALRGPLSAACLDIRDVALGDPGLLAPDLDLPKPESHGQIGIILHFKQSAHPELAERLKRDGRFRMIYAGRSALDVVPEIAACRHIYSSSLHGLVVADSFGIPNTWLDGSDIRRPPEFKVYDYGLAIERAFPKPLDLSAVFDHASTLPAKMPDELPYARGVEDAQIALRASFPQELCAPRREAAMAS